MKIIQKTYSIFTIALFHVALTLYICNLAYAKNTFNKTDEIASIFNQNKIIQAIEESQLNGDDSANSDFLVSL